MKTEQSRLCVPLCFAIIESKRRADRQFVNVTSIFWIFFLFDFGTISLKPDRLARVNSFDSDPKLVRSFAARC